jgi:hypothetical protein
MMMLVPIIIYFTLHADGKPNTLQSSGTAPRRRADQCRKLARYRTSGESDTRWALCRSARDALEQLCRQRGAPSNRHRVPIMSERNAYTSPFVERSEGPSGTDTVRTRCEHVVRSIVSSLFICKACPSSRESCGQCFPLSKPVENLASCHQRESTTFAVQLIRWARYAGTDGTKLRSGPIWDR